MKTAGAGHYSIPIACMLSLALFVTACGGGGGSNTPDTCASLAGNWNYSNSGAYTCWYYSSGTPTSETNSPGGSGTITISQNGCDISWAATPTVSRTGTITNSSVQISGIFIYPPNSNFSFTKNEYNASGMLSSNGNTLNLAGTMEATGSYLTSSLTYTFSCTGTDISTYTRI